MAIKQRLEKLRHRLVEEELDSIIVSQPENRCYLSGFDGSTAILLISQDSAILITDFRYLEQAELQAPDFKSILLRDKSRQRLLLELASDLGSKRLGFEASNICFTDYRHLNEEAEKLELQLVPTEGLVESIRTVKEEEEITFLVEAAGLADAAMEYISGEIHPGMNEREVAWEIERFLRENGSELLPFNIIVASGPNAALPHAKPTERLISSGEPVIIDLGARISGYASDLSRTLCLNSNDVTFTEIYDLVLKAQITAINYLEADMSGEQVDSYAREIIDRGGYKDAFGHGLGHGVGLAAHELPRLGPNSKDTLVENMVFTIEPGIYLSGWGGVRIEDMVMVEEGRAKIISKVRK
ncbi:M24 family metallopeptidase [Chloroflexota bacterium]